MAGERGIPDDAVRAPRRAAPPHDIGKLGVPNGILDRPGRLDGAELEVVRHDPRHAEEILVRVRAFTPIAFVAGAHHERRDGRGHHRGLSGAGVPLGARVLAIADVFEAMHADRPYRAGMPQGRILGIMRAELGAAFDGHCAAAPQGSLERGDAPQPVSLPA